MGRIMSFGQDGQLVRDFDKSEYDFLRRYGRTPDEIMTENAKLREVISDGEESARLILDESRALEADNARLREQLERVQPTDCEGNVLDIADTVSMLRSEYDGDHELEDVVTELALTKWGGDRWIVRGSKGEAWACDCTKTGYDEAAYEASDDVEPFDEPTLLEVENAKLRELASELWVSCPVHDSDCDECKHKGGRTGCELYDRMRELEVDG